jgi:hypothetical protein
MDELRAITNHINTFVRFFESINCLFWQIRWLEDNISKAQFGRIAIVLLIFGFCALLTFLSTDKGKIFIGGATGNTALFISICVIVILIIILVWLIYQRNNNASYLPVTTNHNEYGDEFYMGNNLNPMVLGIPVQGKDFQPSAPTMNNKYR